MFQYHPHQNVYFNFLAGKDVYKKYEVDYWGLSNRKFLENVALKEKNKVKINHNPKLNFNYVNNVNLDIVYPIYYIPASYI